MPLAEFFRRVGLAAYGTSWRAEVIKSLSASGHETVPVGSDADLAWNVREQIILALAANVIRAAVPLVVPKITAASGGSADPEDDDDLLTDDDEEIGAEPRLVVFAIDPGFWSASPDQANVNWEASQISIRSEHLYDISSSKLEPIARRYVVGPSYSNVPILILNPESAIMALYRYEELPDDPWFSRYNVYRKTFMVELVASAWRFLAVAKPEAKHGVITALVGAMRSYLEAQGLDPDAGQGPSEAVLKELASRIIIQWKEQNLTASVLVSTNPRKPKS